MKVVIWVWSSTRKGKGVYKSFDLPSVPRAGDAVDLPGEVYGGAFFDQGPLWFFDQPEPHAEARLDLQEPEGEWDNFVDAAIEQGWSAT